MRKAPRRAKIDPDNPSAWATDDRSGFIGNLRNAVFQHDWAGTGLVNRRILVFPDQLDEPQRQLGTILISADPLPIQNARPGNGLPSEQVIMATSAYTASVNDIVNCDGTFTVTAQTAVGVAGQPITVENVGTGTITLATTGGQTIDGASTYTLLSNNVISIRSSGLNWVTWQQ